MKWGEKGKTLFIMPGGIGNMVLLLPAIKAYALAYPAAFIGVLALEKAPLDLVKNQEYVKETILIDKKTRASVLGMIGFILTMRSKKYDIAIAASGVNPVKAGALAVLSGIGARAGECWNCLSALYNRTVRSSGLLHEADRNMAIVGLFGAGGEPLPVLDISPGDNERVTELLDRAGVEEDDVIIGMHPGSGKEQGEKKRWPLEKFKELAEIISRKTDAKVVVLGGPKEEGFGEEIVASGGHKVLNFINKLEMPLSAAMIKRCRAFVSNDSGLGHIAAAVGTPLVSIFGPTDPEKTRPRGAVKVVRKVMPCQPCFRKGAIKCEGSDCLTSLGAQEVFKELAVFL
ncbi:MAG: glycosyltransferase family 9 protein [Candidatus Omnitrophica bacterium]|nr:glycosyltransferase family 9 protein [Candidatus Omnitrophota bacterium]